MACGSGRSGSDDVELWDRDELLGAVRSTVARSGFSVDELRAQAESGMFVSERARQTWRVVSSAESLLAA